MEVDSSQSRSFAMSSEDPFNDIDYFLEIRNAIDFFEIAAMWAIGCMWCKKQFLLVQTDRIDGSEYALQQNRPKVNLEELLFRRWKQVFCRYQMLCAANTLMSEKIF